MSSKCEVKYLGLEKHLLTYLRVTSQEGDLARRLMSTNEHEVFLIFRHSLST